MVIAVACMQSNGPPYGNLLWKSNSLSCTHLTSYRVMKRRDSEVVCKYSRDGDTLVYIRTCSCTAGLEHEIAELFPGVLEKASTHPGLSRKASSAERPRMLTTKRFVRSVLI